MRLLGPWLCGVLWLASCERDDPTQAPESPTRLELEGCAVRTSVGCWRPPPAPSACERSSSTGGSLSLWADQPVELSFTPEATVTSRPMGDGFVWRIPEDAELLVVRSHGTTLMTMPLRSPTAPEEAASRSTLARLDTRTDTLLSAAKAATDDLPHQRFEESTQEAFALARTLGDLDHASCHARRGLFVALVYAKQFGRAAAWAEQLRKLDPVTLRTDAAQHFYLGMLAGRFGEPQAALDHYATAKRVLTQRGATDDPFYMVALRAEGLLLAELGEDARAQALVHATDDPDSTCTLWLKSWSNRLWLSQVLREHGNDGEDPTPEYEEIEQMMFDDPSCFDEALLPHLRLNRAIAETREGRFERAHLAFAQLDVRNDPELAERIWVEEVRLALHTHLPAPMPPAVAASSNPADRWRRAYWEGRWAEDLGRSQDAIAAYRAAEDVLTAFASLLRIDQGREGILMGRQTSAARLVELLLDEGRTSEALCAARLARSRTTHLLARAERLGALSAPQLDQWRHARARELRLEGQIAALHDERRLLPLDARADVERAIERAQEELSAATDQTLEALYGASRSAVAMSCDDLRSPPPGDVAFLLFPLDPEQRRWAVFGFDDQRRVVTRIAMDPQDPAPLAATLEDTFAGILGDANIISILPTGSAWSIAYASLPWRDSTLLEHAPLLFSLDLASVPAEHELPATAVVVGDPSGDLHHARAEAESVAATLRGRGWTVETLMGSDATPERLRHALTEASLLHFAGHASEAGAHGWDSRIRLGDGARLDAQDILSLEAPPRIAILPACEVAASSTDTLGGGMNVARSLLLSGTRFVVGGTRAVDDMLARRVSESLYESEVPRTPRDAARRLRDVLLARGEAEGVAQLSAFVVLAP